MVKTKPVDFMVAFIFFAMIIGSGIGLIDIAYSKNNNFITAENEIYENFKQTFDKRQSLQSNITAMEQQIQEMANPSPLEAISIFFIKGFNFLQSQFLVFELFTDVVQGIPEIFGLFIPDWVATMLSMLIISVLIYSIVSAILQRDI